jgi:8-oxo-dGTP pyrophosphatase MutT (NUDIX family)
MKGAEEVIERKAIRAILLTRENEILLLRIRQPDTGEWFWITPGGGLEAGETIEEGLRRELLEELGLTQFVIGPLVWQRQHTFNWAGKRLCQFEQYYIVHANRFEPQMFDAAEADFLDRFHWWPLDELPHSRERITPLSLVEIVTSYLTLGSPQEPLGIEILVD